MIVPRRRPAGRADPARRRRRLPHLARGAGARAGRPLPPHARPRADARLEQLRRASSASWLDGFWERADVEVDGPPRDPAGGALEPLPARAGRRPAPTGSGIPAKGVTGSRLRAATTSGTPRSTSLPFLTYTTPQLRPQRAALPLPHARRRPAPRAEQLAQRGALFPWRTINGEEASAYYAAGTAQYHINADIAYALSQYVARHRRRRLPGARGRRHPRRDRAAVGRPRLLAQQRRRRRSTSTASPGPTSTRPSSTTTSSRT